MNNQLSIINKELDKYRAMPINAEILQKMALLFIVKENLEKPSVCPYTELNKIIECKCDQLGYEVAMGKLEGILNVHIEFLQQTMPNVAAVLIKKIKEEM